MNRPFAALLISFGAIGFALACNTAAVQQPTPVDAGSGLCPTAPVVECDASAAVQGCTPQPDSGIAATSEIPSAIYPFTCKVNAYGINNDTGECQVTSACTCESFDGGDGGHWACF